MAYRYSFDHTPWGMLRFPRGWYEVVQNSLQLLRNEIQTWNERALAHGALSIPYAEEIGDLDRMISYGGEVLSDERIGMVTIPTMSVGSARYIKASLVLMVARGESDLRAKVDASWPGGVVSALRQSLENVSRISQEFDVPSAEILDEISVGLGRAPSEAAPEWDVFISHASEDKESFVRPLAEKLASRGLKVWFDELTLRLGDSLRRSIDSGLSRSKYGIVVISPSFLEKEWPQRELDGLTAREIDGNKVILPIWHEIGFEGVRRFSPTLADRLAAKSSQGMDRVVEEIVQAIRA